MKKKYRLLIDSPEIPKGTIATWDEVVGGFTLKGDNIYGIRTTTLGSWQIENRPTVWAQVIEEQEKEDPYCDCSNDTFVRCPSCQTKKKQEWQEVGQTVFVLSQEGDINPYVFTGSIFPTREVAETELLLRKLMAKRWKPKQGDIYYYYNNMYKRIEKAKFTQWHESICELLLGNCHKTKEEAEAYGKQLQKCIDFYLSQTNKE